MARNPVRQNSGPFYAAHLKAGDPYELADGHPIECLPAGGRHAKANLVGGLAIETDPDVESAAVDAGYSFGPKDLRAPDIAVGNIPDEPGWVKGVPPLAVEYADTGQNEQELQTKIKDLLLAGTRYIWVVRLSGPRRVEVYESGQKRRTVRPGQQLVASGVLQNPLLVEALYDPKAAHEAALRNLLQRQGYKDLNAVREEGRTEGMTEGMTEGELALVLRQLRRRFDALSPELEERVRSLGSAQLETLGEDLLDFQNEVDLAAWFK